MKIKKLHLISYGKFKDVTLSFKDGLNIVAGDNEAGKSTVTAFIRQMLYGFGTNRKSTLLPDRTKYMPWSGETMRGEVEFEKNGKTYLLSRTAGKTQRGDRFTLTNAETGQDVTDEFSGKDILPIDEDGFSNTVYVRQLGASVSPSENVSRKLMNLSESGSEDTSLSLTKDHLEKMLHVLRYKKGRGGKIDITEGRLSALYGERSAAKEEYAERERKEAEKKKLESRLSELEPELQKQTERLSQMEKNALYTEYFNAEKDVERKAEEEKRRQEEADIQNEKLASLSVFRESVPYPYRDAEHTGDADAEYVKATQKAKTGRLQMIIGAAILVVFGVLGFFMSLLWCGTVLGIALLGFGIWQYQKGMRLKAAAEEQRRKNEAQEKERQEFLARYHCETKEEYEEKRARFRTLSDEAEIIRKQKEDAEEYRKEAEERLGKAKDAIMRRFGEMEAFTPVALSEDILERKNELENEKHRLTARVAELRADLEHRSGRTLSEIEAEIKEETESLSASKKSEQALRLALDALEHTEGKLSESFAPALNRRASEILSHITEGKHAEMMLNTEFEVRLHEDGVQDLAYFSNGTADQVYFALRLALAELIFEGEEVPLILDDPFIEYDIKRERAAMEFLKEYAKDRQVILFTARPPEDADILL